MIAVYAPAAKQITIGEFRCAVAYRVQDTISPRALPQVRTAVQVLFVDPGER